MRHIRTYEAFDFYWERYFWKIPTEKPYYNICLRKIGMSRKTAESWDNMFDDDKQGDYIIIFMNAGWSWTGFEPGENMEKKIDSYKSSYTYMGTPEITPEDIKEYEMKLAAKKYNL